MPHPLINEVSYASKLLYSPMFTTLHSVIDIEEYEEHEKYFFLPLVLATMEIQIIHLW